MVTIYPPSIEYWPSGPPACKCRSNWLISPEQADGFPRLVAHTAEVDRRTLCLAGAAHICTGTGCTASVLTAQKSAIKLWALWGIFYWYEYIEVPSICLSIIYTRRCLQQGQGGG